MSRTGQSTDTESGFLVVRGGGETWGVPACGARLVLEGDKNILELKMMVAHLTCREHHAKYRAG